MRLFVTGTGTGVGKTVVTRSLAEALRADGRRVTALKPIETGCDPDPLDAVALAEAAGRPELARLPGLYRARAPLAPHAAALEGEPALDWSGLLAALAPHREDDPLLVEGAGGLLVPIDPSRVIADLAVALALPILVVAPNALGVLSDVLATVECAHARGLSVAAVILREPATRDRSFATNVDTIASRLEAPILDFPHVASDAQRLEAGRAILGPLVTRTRRAP